MRDKGGIRRHTALKAGCRLLAACALCSAVAPWPACAQSGIEQFFTNPRLAEKNPAGKTATDAVELSQDQAVWTALAFEDNDQLRQLLKRGANPNITEELSLMTPLMAAETLQLTWTLLENGANARLTDRVGRTALHYAPKMRDAALIVPLLVRAGGDLNARSDDAGAITPLFCAIESYLEGPDRAAAGNVVRVMVRYGADINATDANGATVLAIAAAHNRPELIKLLMDLGADPAKRLSNGRTPMDYAKEANAVEAIQFLGGTATAGVSGN
jgi:ankyrin repeat protein